MTAPRLLDLFCGAGGATRGYQQAGFHVTGIDLHPQPNYCGDQFHQADALTFPLDGYDAIHVSPPCQAYSAMTACRPGLSDEYPDLVDAIRDQLEATGLPYVIENVVGAPLAKATDLFGAHGVVLCGRMFGLDLYRHRVFETSLSLVQPHHPPHLIPASKAGHWREGTVISVSGNCSPIAVARTAMGIDWMTRDELSESIPPAYTQWIGEQLAAHLEAAA